MGMDGFRINNDNYSFPRCTTLYKKKNFILILSKQLRSDLNSEYNASISSSFADETMSVHPSLNLVWIRLTIYYP